MHEWSLFIFTLTMQAAIGGIVILGIYHLLLDKMVNKDKIFAAVKSSLAALTGISAVGLVVSFFHLGSPFNAFSAILNISSSWLSREMLFTGMFILLLLLTTYLLIKNKELHTGLVLATGIAGLIDVFCMASIYSNTVITPWVNYNIYIAFYGTTFLLGTSLISVIFIPIFKNSEGALQRVLAPTILIVMVSLLTQLIAAVIYGAGEASQVITILRWSLASAGVLVIVQAFWPKVGKGMQVNPGLLYYSFAFILASEFIGRYLFF